MDRPDSGGVLMGPCVPFGFDEVIFHWCCPVSLWRMYFAWVLLLKSLGFQGEADAGRLGSPHSEETSALLGQHLDGYRTSRGSQNGKTLPDRLLNGPPLHGD